MKIGDSLNKAFVDQLITSKRDAKPETNPAADVAGTSTAGLGALSRQIHELETHLSQVDGFDAARVEAIKAAIRSGNFKVDSEVVADRLIASVRELVGK
jgi:negative regulator of flagellin synthesis FlgM